MIRKARLLFKENQERDDTERIERLAFQGELYPGKTREWPSGSSHLGNLDLQLVERAQWGDIAVRLKRSEGRLLG